jgi:hypothetical protein
MNSEQDSLRESLQGDPRVVPPAVATARPGTFSVPSAESLDSFARPLIPAGPGTALAIVPTIGRRR